ncbi:hypothetical protein AM593_08650, partial [Mytilus galloprovincialis]
LTVNDVAIEDSRLRTGWYRIDSVTGNDIVNNSVPMMQCGTLYPLWMKGSIPDGRERDTTVNRKVCRSGLTDTCVKEYDIKVRNCGTYRTYYLAQLDFDKSAYCFGKEEESADIMVIVSVLIVLVFVLLVVIVTIVISGTQM